MINFVIDLDEKSNPMKWDWAELLDLNFSLPKPEEVRDVWIERDLSDMEESDDNDGRG
jgi:hypothetical protein